MPVRQRNGASATAIARLVGLAMLALPSTAFLHSYKTPHAVRACGRETYSNGFPNSVPRAFTWSLPSSSTSDSEVESERISRADLESEIYETNLQLAALADQCSVRRGNNTGISLEAYRLLRSMKQPDTVAYNSVLKSFAKTSPARLSRLSVRPDDDLETIARLAKTRVATLTAAEFAEQLLEEMKRLHKRQTIANQEWYQQLENETLDELQLSRGAPRVYVKPNVRSYSTVMDAYARNGDAESAAKAQRLLEELQERHDETGDFALLPNLITYNTCLSAWARAGCCTECLELYENMPLSPDVISANAVLHALARSGWSDAGERAQKVLDDLPYDGISPNARSYTTCMDAWGRSGRPAEAHSLLTEMLDLYDTGDDTFRPNCVSFSTVFHAYATSKDPDKAIKSFKLFQEMKSRGIKPNRVVLNNLLNCFATSRPQPETIKLVENLYQVILKHQAPDHFTFGTVLKAAGNLLRKDRVFAPSVFREACERGHVSAGVLWQLRQAVPVDTYRALVGTDSVDISSLPVEWTRNVREDRSRRRRR